MMTIIPFSGGQSLPGSDVSFFGPSTSDASRVIPAAHRFGQAARRWHAGEAPRTRLITRGAIMPIGGEQLLAPASPVLRGFFDLAGGRGARIMILPASGDPRDGEAYRRLLTRRGASAEILTIATRDDANDPDLTTRLAAMTGLFIVGGAHGAFQLLISGTRLAAAIRAGNERGLVVAGCGAGAPLLCRHQAPNVPATGVPEPVEAPGGLGLLDDVVIDRQPTTAERFEQLLATLAGRPALVAVCLKPESALIVTADRLARVIGERSVIVIDGRTATADRRDAAGGSPLLSSATIHLLAPGNVFDLERGRVTDPRRGPIGRPIG